VLQHGSLPIRLFASREPRRITRAPCP